MIATKKTILYIGGFELPDKNAAAQRVLANAKIFKELGFNVVFVGIDKSLPLDTHIKDTKSTVQGFDTWSIPYPNNKKIWIKHITSIEHLSYLVDNYYREELYSVVCYNYPAIAQYKIKNMCHIKNAFFLPDTTEWYANTGGGILFDTIKWIDTNLRMRVIQPRADGVITISRYLTNFYKERDCLTIEIPTLYDVESITCSPSMEEDGDVIKLMYAGSTLNLARMDKKRTSIKDRLDKIIILLDKVYEQRTNFMFDVYGLTQENYLLVFPEHMSILHKLKGHIEFHGRKSHLEIIEKTKKSHFTIFIRNTERVIEAGFPSKFSESISYGTPVISNMISNIEPYVVEGKNSYIISLDNEEKQVKKMLQILSLSNDEIQKMKNHCLQNKIFDYKKYIIQVKQFLSMLENKKMKL